MRVKGWIVTKYYMQDQDIELDPKKIKPYESDDFELGQACSVIDPECEACQ